MTSHLFWPLQNHWFSQFRIWGSSKRLLSFFVLATLLNGCSLFSYPQESEKPTLDARRRQISRSLRNKLEWAIQSYESGQYQEAIERMATLRQEGPAVPEFELISFYVGMSQFRLGNLSEAIRELTAFLQTNPTRPETQEARLALLLAYEKSSDWSKILGLAAETENQSMFQNNKVILQLVWARALSERNELQGARAILKEAELYLQNSGSSEKSTSALSDSEHDLWGRFHFTSIVLQLRTCSNFQPREIGEGKHTKRLYGPWLESMVDCLQNTLTETNRDLFFTESSWAAPASEEVFSSLKKFGAKISENLKKEKEILDRHRALQKLAREQLYRFMTKVDEELKALQSRKLATSQQERIRKEVDRLLIEISSSS